MTITDTNPSLTETNSSESDLIHQVYDTALDNSLWPEMIVAIVDHVSHLEAMPEGQLDRARIESINAHFNRAYTISEKMVDLQERNVLQAQILEALSCDVTLFSLSGEPFYKSRVGTQVDTIAKRAEQTKPVSLPVPETPSFTTHYKAAQTDGKLQV